jgi:TRAP-type C4-dicarboxylate transport system substrate-binding protein
MTFQKTALVSLIATSFAFAGGAYATTFKVAVGDAQGSAQWELGTKFKAAFEAKTGGKHKIDLFPNGQLGSEETTVNSASLGTLDMSILAVNNITPFSPTVGILTLPYVILSAAEAKTLVTGEVGKELTANTVRDAGVRIIGWTFTGFRVLTNSKKPVKTLADLKGLKIRVPKNEIMIASYQAWGINPTPMAWSETFTALQQGVVDGRTIRI